MNDKVAERQLPSLSCNNLHDTVAWLCSALCIDTLSRLRRSGPVSSSLRLSLSWFNVWLMTWEWRRKLGTRRRSSVTWNEGCRKFRRIWNETFFKIILLRIIKSLLYYCFKTLYAHTRIGWLWLQSDTTAMIKLQLNSGKTSYICIANTTKINPIISIVQAFSTGIKYTFFSNLTS